MKLYELYTKEQCDAYVEANFTHPELLNAHERYVLMVRFHEVPTLDMTKDKFDYVEARIALTKIEQSITQFMTRFLFNAS